MKGQAEVIAGISSVVFLATFILVGMVVYGYTAEVTPHDDLKYNETLAASPTLGAAYTLDHTPILLDTTLEVWNSTHYLLTKGATYNVTTAGVICLYANCTNCDGETIYVSYTYDWSTITGQTEFWSSTTETSYAGFALVSIGVIVIASVVIILAVLWLR